MNVILYRYDIIIHSVRYIVNREDGKKLDPMNLIVAKNIRRLREENKLSMDELSRLSGVSKSMLAQIERGDGNPTISTLWKISNGMKVPFDALTVRPENLYQIVKTSEIQPLGRSETIRSFRMMRTGDLPYIIWNWRKEASGSRNLI